jgi:hypothetical protein
MIIMMLSEKMKNKKSLYFYILFLMCKQKYKKDD